MRLPFLALLPLLLAAAAGDRGARAGEPQAVQGPTSAAPLSTPAAAGLQSTQSLQSTGAAPGTAARPALSTTAPVAATQSQAPAQAPAPPPGSVYPPQRNVVLVIIDGVRQQELYGKALDDNNKPVRASELFPNLGALRKTGLFFPRMRISNPAGVSLPAYADIFAGRRQERILSNIPPAADFRSHYPTLFQTVKKGLRLGFDGVALHASWTPLCTIAFQPPDPAVPGQAMTPSGDSYGVNIGSITPQSASRTRSSGRPMPIPPDDDFYRSCGFQTNAGAPQYIKPELYGGSRTDADTFLELAQEIPKRHPRLLVVQLVDADEEAHLHNRVTKRTGIPYGIFHYHQALRQDDYFLGRLWALLQADPFYKDNTYLFVTTDHGRDTHPEAAQWSVHGHCQADYGGKRTCSGCSSVFALAVGPGIPARTVKTPYTHADLAPTIARILGVPMPTATGRAMREVTDTLHVPAPVAQTAPVPLSLSGAQEGVTRGTTLLGARSVVRASD